ncbi:MAG: galactokinase [Oscillospiraceae bacterium]|nr:galactokinase [Oscillospiraceae bacterium]
MRCEELKKAVLAGEFDTRLKEVYPGRELSAVHGRIASVLDGFAKTYPNDTREVFIFSAPGRTELGGNHTDHQYGQVLAGSIDMDTLAVVARSEGTLIRVQSLGHALSHADFSDTRVVEEEKGSSSSLLRGTAVAIAERGYTVHGFDAYTETEVLRGSGLSSSAAFEVLIGEIINELDCGGALTSTEIAQIGQFAENVYYGKPCGLMDQMACATGGVIAIDFYDPKEPKVARVAADFAKEGFALCIIDSGAGHADLDDEYAAIPSEMGAVAKLLGQEKLSRADEGEYWAKKDAIVAACGERAALRAEHFFGETKRAKAQYEALTRGDMKAYIELVRESGESSEKKLQNVSIDRPDGDRLLRVIERARELATADGVGRVHGGGFAGTVQALVPMEKLSAFVAGMEELTGKGSCHVIRLRDHGSIKLL